LFAYAKKEPGKKAFNPGAHKSPLHVRQMLLWFFFPMIF